MLQLLNHRLKVTTLDGKTIVGQMIAFDKHMNLVLADSHEFRRVSAKNKKPKKTESTNPIDAIPAINSEREEKRALGLVILRGEEIVSVVVESGPPPSHDNKQRVPASVALTAAGGRANFPGGTQQLGKVTQPIPYDPRATAVQPPLIPGFIPPPIMPPGMMIPMPGMQFPPPPPK